jgi:hypothetical protein
MPERAEEIARRLEPSERLVLVAATRTHPTVGSYTDRAQDAMRRLEGMALLRTYVVGDGGDGWLGCIVTDLGYEVAALLAQARP